LEALFAWGHKWGHKKKPTRRRREASPGNVINLMDALRQSLASDETAKPAKLPQAAKSPPAKKAAAKKRKASQGESR
jgi:non-homologous end joining protein Ku